MKRLSDPGTRRHKLTFTAVLACTVLGVFVAQAVTNEPVDWGVVALAAVVFAGVLAWILRRIPWSLADEVSDDGRALVIRRGSARRRISFDEIEDVVRDDAPAFARNIRIALRRPDPVFGREIVFRPDHYRTLTGASLSRVIAELRSRAGLPPEAYPPGALAAGETPAGRSRLSLRQRRTIIALVLLVVIVPLINHVLGLRLFAPYDRAAASIGVLAMLLALWIWGPNPREFDEMVDEKRTRKNR